jgi:tetratricopeptide (TPR) repeat protein
MAPGFRIAICQQAYRPEYDVWEPRLLPRHLWTEQWSMLVEALAGIERADLDECSRLCHILNALAMYEPILLYLNSFKECPEGCSAEEADLAYRYAFAESMLFVGAHGRLHSPARFALVAERAPRGCRAAFAASLYLIVYTARFERDWQSTHKWYQVAREMLTSLNYPTDTLRYLMGESRFHRAAAYLPFLKGDVDQALKELEIGLEFANRMRPCDEDELILRDENLYPLLQSTAKAYMASGDMDRALEYLRKVVTLDPWDSIARLELGNALFQLDRFEEAAASYEWAISLAPPGMAHAAYLAGEAYRQMGRDARATHMYLRSLTADPDGISPKQKLAEISSLPAARDYATTLC